MDIAAIGAAYVMPLINWFIDDPERPGKVVDAAKSLADSLGLMPPPPPPPPKPSLFSSPSKLASWVILSIVIMAVASLKSAVKKATVGRLTSLWGECDKQTRAALCAVGVVVLGVLIAISSDELCAASISGVKMAWVCDAFTKPSWYQPIVVVGASAAALAAIYFGASWLINVKVKPSARSLETTSLEAVLDGVPGLPEQYQPRPELEATHRDALLRSTGTMAITASTTGVSGPAGAGKSTTAIVLARDPLVRAHFGGGVIWLAFGRERTGAEVLRTLAGRLGVATETDAGRQMTRDELTRATSRALDGKRTLLVLDDIWTREQLEAFVPLSAEGGLLGRLVTTRNQDLAGEHAQKVEQLQEEEGVRMLAGYMGITAEELGGNAAATRLVEMCRGNPAQLRSVAALCRKKGVEATLDYLEKCQQKMRHAKLPDAEGYGTLFDALAGTLQFVAQENAGLAERCTMLAVFPEDSQVPLSVVGQVWGLDELETEEAVRELESWHLVDADWSARRKVEEGRYGDPDRWEGRTLSLIDLHLDYLRASAKEDLARWHAALLSGCGRRKLGKKEEEEGREDDAYWGGKANVLHHLRGCGWEAGALGGEVTELELRHWGVDAEDAKGLAAMVAASGSLATLDLGYNNIGDAGAKAIADAIGASGSLTSLDLQINQIGDDGAKALAAGIAASGSLEVLDLRSNKIGDEGAKALAGAIGASGSLALKTLYVPRAIENHAALVAACKSKGVELESF